MSKRFYFVKAALFIFVAASVFAGCQKDQVASDNSISTENGDARLKYAVVVNPANDERDFGTASNWLGKTGSLSFLKESQNLSKVHSELFANVPSGIKVTKKSYVYVTFVGSVASYNNLLGYYTYNENQITGDVDHDRAYILGQIFSSNMQGINFSNVIYAKSKDLEFKTTYRLDNNGQEFEAGTVIGFYLLPNASGGTTPKIQMKGGVPQFISTDASVNATVGIPQGKVSHIMGQSACGDMVIAFEDLNSLYSKTSDEDYNDLVFVVGDNLEFRTTSSIEPYGSGNKPFELLGSNCVTCIDAANELGSLVNFIAYKSTNPIYLPLFNAPFNTRFLPLNETAPLYAKLVFAHSGSWNQVGWYYYTDGMTLADIKAQVTDASGNIKNENIIFRNLTINAASSEFIRLGGTGMKFAKDAKVGFFIAPFFKKMDGNLPFLTAQNSVGVPVRVTSLKDMNRQAQYVLKASCQNVLVAFEDWAPGDEDFNDVIFQISDNNASTNLQTLSIDNANLYPLSELNKAYKIAYPSR